jgi:hypothetical protein
MIVMGFKNCCISSAVDGNDDDMLWNDSEGGDTDNIYIYIYIYIYRVSQEECAILWEGVPYVKLYRFNPKHLYPKLIGL